MRTASPPPLLSRAPPRGLALHSSPAERSCSLGSLAAALTPTHFSHTVSAILLDLPCVARHNADARAAGAATARNRLVACFRPRRCLRSHLPRPARSNAGRCTDRSASSSRRCLGEHEGGVRGARMPRTPHALYPHLDPLPPLHASTPRLHPSPLPPASTLRRACSQARSITI